MARASSRDLLNNLEDHAADIIIGAFFFALCSCKFSKVPLVGKTVKIRLGGIQFYSNDFQVIPHHHPKLLEVAAFVWVLFEDQKNRLKCDTCTQMKTHDPLLCPVLQLGRAAQQVLLFVKGCNEDTPLCTFHKKRRKSKFITQDYCKVFIRKICSTYGGVKRFSFHPQEIFSDLEQQ